MAVDNAPDDNVSVTGKEIAAALLSLVRQRHDAEEQLAEARRGEIDAWRAVALVLMTLPDHRVTIPDSLVAEYIPEDWVLTRRDDRLAGGTVYWAMTRDDSDRSQKAARLVSEIQGSDGQITSGHVARPG